MPSLPASRTMMPRAVGGRSGRSKAATMAAWTRPPVVSTRLILGFGVLDLVSGDQGADQRAEESLASFARVMDELKEPKIEGELLLRDAAMRPQPGAQQ